MQKTMIPPEASEFRDELSRPFDRRSPLRWIVSHSLRYPLLPLLMVAAAAVNNAAYGTIQVHIGRAFDVVAAAGGPRAGLLAPVLVIGASALVQGLSGLGRNFSVEFLAQRIERDCREEYYTDLLGKSQTFHGGQRTGDLMARATNDVRMINLLFSPGLMLITDSALAYLIPAAMILLIHPVLIMVPALFTVFLVITVIDYNRRLEPVSAAQQEEYGVLSSIIEEAVTGIATVKTSVRESYELDKFLKNARIFRDYYVRQGRIQAAYIPMLAFSICWGLAFFHALFLVTRGVISPGQAVGFMGLFGTFRFVTYISIFSFNMVQLGMASAARILDILNTRSELDENRTGHAGPMRGEVRFENVSFSLAGRQVLRDVCFTVPAGATVALVGRTGSGKSTLTRLINRIFDPQSGRVLVDGVDARDWNLESLRSQCATIEQDVFLFSRSLRENISFGRPDASSADIAAAAEAAQISAFIEGLPDDYETLVGERGVMLSGGQKQRIALARAFIADPRILILDDSTSSIDSKTEDEIQRALKKISSQRTTFIITHRLSQIRWADLIVLLDRGGVLDQGRHEELLARCEEYRRLFPYTKETAWASS